MNLERGLEGPPLSAVQGVSAVTATEDGEAKGSEPPGGKKRKKKAGDADSISQAVDVDADEADGWRWVRVDWRIDEHKSSKIK